MNKCHITDIRYRKLCVYVTIKYCEPDPIP